MDIFETIQKSDYARMGDDIDEGHLRTVGHIETDPSYLDSDEKYLILDAELESEEAFTIDGLADAERVAPNAFRLKDGPILSFYCLTPVTGTT